MKRTKVIQTHSHARLAKVHGLWRRGHIQPRIRVLLLRRLVDGAQQRRFGFQLPMEGNGATEKGARA
jgi:hypothetical protein